jgi:hypothetical protein
MSDDIWIERAQSYEAKYKTAQGQIDRLKEDARFVLDTFGARKKSDGTFDINFDQFVERLGPEQALAVRGMIDQRYGISGDPGEKPKIRIKAA